MLTNVLTDCLPFLLGLFKARDWTVFEEFVLSNPETFQCISKSIYECEEFNGMTLLHACVRFDPPISVLQKVIELHPQALRKEDCVRRTPLHIAAGSGASSFDIKILTVVIQMLATSKMRMEGRPYTSRVTHSANSLKRTTIARRREVHPVGTLSVPSSRAR